MLAINNINLYLNKSLYFVFIVVIALFIIYLVQNMKRVLPKNSFFNPRPKDFLGSENIKNKLIVALVVLLLPLLLIMLGIKFNDTSLYILNILRLYTIWLWL